jgi:hypothetical protein
MMTQFQISAMVTLWVIGISFSVPIQGQMTPVTGKLKDGVLTINFTVQGYDISADLKKTLVK